MRPPRIKVCGITREADVELLARNDIDALGFIFHPQSDRRLSLTLARRLRQLVPPTMLVFGVVGVMPIDDCLRLAEVVRVDVLQVHGKPLKKNVLRLQREGYRVASVYQPVTDPSWRDSGADLVVFDNSTRSHPGGTGEAFDWEKVEKPYPGHLMLAGGLNENNIATAIKHFHPAIVDLNSGVESAPGVKSAKKLAVLLRKIRT